MWLTFKRIGLLPPNQHKIILEWKPKMEKVLVTHSFHGPRRKKIA